VKVELFSPDSDLAVDAWSDAALIEAVRVDPPNEAALDALVERYWESLFGRCQILTLDYDKARDLAQAAWCRLLKTRHALKPDGNLPAYLNTIATNLFHDSCRTARRAGPMAEYRLKSLEAEQADANGETFVLLDMLPDLKAMPADEQATLALDIDKALKHLTPQLREVLVARFITGESCAEIGRRYGRTEQSISGWVRQALRDMKRHLEGLAEYKEGQFKG
jgi:RNA polymerase sigma factor (sigma-70 family)